MREFLCLIQTVLGSDSVPNFFFFFEKVSFVKKKSADDQKIMKYYLACRVILVS